MRTQFKINENFGKSRAENGRVFGNNFQTYFYTILSFNAIALIKIHSLFIFKIHLEKHSQLMKHLIFHEFIYFYIRFEPYKLSLQTKSETHI